VFPYRLGQKKNAFFELAGVQENDSFGHEKAVKTFLFQRNGL
jgi:hypothetical protein